MPWNQPGNNGQRPDPWGGGGNKNGSPPDLDKLLGDLLRKLKSLFGRKSASGGAGPSMSLPDSGLPAAAGVIFIVLLLVWFLSGFFIVNPAEQAVILRLGRYTGTLQPGLHWIARFIEQKYVLNVQHIYSFAIEGDFLTKSSDQNDLPSLPAEKLVTPGVSEAGASDQSKNLVNIELNVMYRVSDPNAFLFQVVDPDETIRQVADSVLSEVTGTMKLDEVLTTGREFLASKVRDGVRKVLAGYGTGMEVQSVTLRKVQAPDQVRAAFNDVNRAEQDRKTAINKAQAYASRVIPLAEGRAARILADASAHREQIVLKAKAEVARYQALQQVFASAPEVTRERMYLDTMQEVMTHSAKLLVDAGSGVNLLNLPLEQLLKHGKLPLETASAGESK